MSQWIDVNALSTVVFGLAGLLHLIIRTGQAIIIQRVEGRRSVSS